MSEEMAVGDKGPSEENKVGGEDAEMESADSVAVSEPPIETAAAEPEHSSAPVEEPPSLPAEEDPPETIAAIREELGIKDDDLDQSDKVVSNDSDRAHKMKVESAMDSRNDTELQDNDIYTDEIFKHDNVKNVIENEGKIKADEGTIKTEEAGDVNVEKELEGENVPKTEASRGVKRRASAAFSDDGMEEFKGFESCEPSSLADYTRIIERLEAEVSAAVKTYKPLKTVMAAPTPRASKRARQDAGRAKWSGPLEEEVSAFVKSFLDEGVKPGKRQRQGTDSSRPSSALSSRSDDAAMSTDASMSPAPPPAPRDLRPLGRQVQQPCSLTCGRGVPTLACAACLCLYHPPCVGFVCIAPPDRFLCKNCRKSSSPPLEPPPLIHKSGVSTSAHHSQMPNIPNMSANMSSNMSANVSAPRRLPVPVPVPVPVPAKVPKNDKRVLLRMKVAGGGPDGERVWAVAKPSTPVTPTPTPSPAPPPPPPAAPTPPVPVLVPALPVAPPACRPSLPQSLAILNGRRFIVVSRALHR